MTWQWSLELGTNQIHNSAREFFDSRLKLRLSWVRRSSLAPDIVEAILADNAPDHLSLRTLYRGITLSWTEQRRELLGI